MGKENLSKGELVRFMALDRCFRDRNNSYNIKKLRDACLEEMDKYMPFRKHCEGDVSERQVKGDYAKMQKLWGFKLKHSKFNERTLRNGRVVEGKDMRAHAYSYEDKDYSILTAKMVDAEESWLDEFKFLAEYFRNKPDFGWIGELSLRIDDARKDQLNVIVPETRSEFILEGFNKYFYNLYNAIQCRKVLKLTYKPYDKDELIWTISPYFLKQYNNRWFLFGWNHERGCITNAALDRIQGVEETDGEYVRHTQVKEFEEIEIFDDYFDDIIGVSKPQNECKTETVKLKFSEKSFHRVRTKAIHPNQRIDLKNRIVTIKLIKNYELIQTILSFGKDVEVIEPLSLRDDISRIAKEMCEMYNA